MAGMVAIGIVGVVIDVVLRLIEPAFVAVAARLEESAS